MSDHDERISRLYHTRDDEQPSDISDAFIKRAARAAVMPRNRIRRWAAPLATAATLLLSLGLLLRIGIETAPPPAVGTLSAPPPAPELAAPESKARIQQFQTEQAIRQRLLDENRQAQSARKATMPMMQAEPGMTTATERGFDDEDAELSELLALKVDELLGRLDPAEPALWRRVIAALKARGRTGDAERLERQLDQIAPP